ncbi:Crp/Fnr family transcriptional regulator [Caulobacter sp. KR2-114]|uniref:Crp/Fnr family transcriptional regulator n=1 Tax=Caulobacter sp. KR2-114 TaxID=3400912 RepID=UPI003C068F87
MLSADLAVLETDRWFAAIAPERRMRLVRNARVRTLTGGGRVYAVGDPPDGLYAVLEGDVRLVNHSAAGQETLALIVAPGAWFGGLSTADGGPRTHDAVAAARARVLHVPQRDFDQAAREDLLLHRDLSLLISAYHRAATTALTQNLTEPLAVRLARGLAAAARGRGDDLIRLRQDELAAMHGVSRQTINRALKRLEAAGLVAVRYGRVEVLDSGRLRALGRDPVL